MTAIPVLIAEKIDYYLWHEIAFPAGTTYGTKNFFCEDVTGINTNVRNSSLPPGQRFQIKRISLKASLGSSPVDVHNLIDNSHFSFETAVKSYYCGQSQLFYKSTASLDTVFASLKKLSKKEQRAILENIKTPSGMELSDGGFTLLDLQFFRGEFTIPHTIQLKKEVKLTCLLEGKLIRQTLS